jgi:YHYH protein
MKTLALFISLSLLLYACKKTDDTSPITTTNTTSGGTDISVLKDKFYSTPSFSSNATATVEGIFLVIKTNAIPDHKSPYYSTSDARYEAYNGTNTLFRAAPNVIAAQTLTFKIPLNPKEATTKSATPMGPIGVSLNGVPFFNQYAAGGAKLTGEINGFDQNGGHPQQQGQYHYHVEPLNLTKNKGSDAFLGVLLDGFPVYGPKENGALVKESDLDAYHGHISKTAEFPNGIYHYHITSIDPYLNGSGFWGTAGTVSQ